jgi:hypothetical protein
MWHYHRMLHRKALRWGRPGYAALREGQLAFRLGLMARVIADADAVALPVCAETAEPEVVAFCRSFGFVEIGREMGLDLLESERRSAPSGGIRCDDLFSWFGSSLLGRRVLATTH